MRKIILVTGLISLLASLAIGQCPTAGFNLTDSVCSQTPFVLTNTSTAGLSYYWDLCPGDLTTAPTLTDISDPALSLPQQLKLVTSNGNYYLFIANYLNSHLLRFDFGNSPNNTPVMYDYGTVGGLINQPMGVDVIEDNGTWYALVALLTSKIIRVDLGTDISANIASAFDLGSFNLNTPYVIRAVKDGTDFYAFVSNSIGNDLTRISFGNSMANSPSGFSSTSNPLFDGSWGLDIVYDCSLNKWLAFYASNSQAKINVIDFGSSLSNSGSVLSPISCVTQPTHLAVVRDGADWHLLINSLSTAIQNITIPGNLLATPSSTQDYFPGLTSPRGIAVYRDTSSHKVFISSGNNISKLVFEKPCSVSPVFSTDPDSVIAITDTSNIYLQISLEVTGPNGEISVFSDSVFVRPIPVVNFTYAPACEGQPTQFTDASVLDSIFTTSWSWDFGDLTPADNNQNPLHTYSTAGAYLVTSTVTYSNGCSSSFSDSVHVNPLPAADFSFIDNQCSFVPVNFNDLSQVFGGATITNWEWDFGDTTAIDTLQNPEHVFTVAGTFTVLLTITASSGCTDTISHSITIISGPDANFNVTSTCVGETANFNNTTTFNGGGNIDYDWNFGDSGTSIIESPTHQYAAVSGFYDVTLVATASNGCADSIVQNIYIANKPVAQFSWSPLVVCEGNQVIFTSTSTGTGGDTIAIYTWDFGDSNGSSVENPVYTYADTGYFDVTLTVTSLTACDSTITQQIYVVPSPTAAFTATNVCLGLTTSFSPSVTTPPNTQVDSIVWDFGDSAIFSGLTSPTHLYITPGEFIVSMTVYNNLGCTALFIDTINVYAIPVADFTTTLLCSDSSATFNGSISTVVNDSISSWVWNFDGMGTGIGDTVLFTFADSGTYNVSLIVTTIHGCQDTTTKPVSVILSPEFDFIFNEPCFNLPSFFIYVPNINPPPDGILSWDFGDGTSSGILNPSYTYNTVDTFWVSLTVEHNATGCASTIYHQLVVKPYPDAGFTFLDNCEGVPVQFNDTSDISAGFIASYNWNFGSLGTSAIPDPMVTPNDSGSFPVTLTVTSGEGCSASITDTLTVYAAPDIAFTPDPLYGSPPLSVNFINNTTGAISYSWNFGDNSTGVGFSPSHLYPDTGLYNVVMVAMSAQGCFDSGHVTVAVLFPFMDLAVDKIFATRDDNLLKLKATLINMGNIPIHTFQIIGNIEDGSAVNEVWTGQLQPGGVTQYEFVSSYDLSSRTTPGYYCIETSQPNDTTDDNPANDFKCAVLSSAFELYNPYPNPFADEVTVGFNLPLEDEYVFRVFDVTGKLVYDSGIQQGLVGYNSLQLFTLNYSKGVYAFTILYRDELKVISVVNR